jgi:carbamoyl-phosphate synthase large subunit
MTEITVLLTSAGVATAVNVIHALRQSSFFNVRIVSVDMTSLSAGLYLADKHCLVPPVKTPQYIDELLHICKNEKVNVLFPLFSGEIGIVASNMKMFADNSINVMLPFPEVVDTCINKVKFLHFLNENGFPYPKTYTLEQVEDESFPLFIKPASGSSSKNTFIIRDYEELIFYMKRHPNSIVQEFISGVEYTVDCLVHHGTVYVISPRSRLNVKDGKSMVGKTVFHPGIITLVKDLLLKIGMNGPCNIQCIEDERGGLHLIEINPRLAAGGLPLTVKAGANIPEMMIRLALGMDVKPVENLQSDVIMIRYLNDIFLLNETNGLKKI